MMEFELTPDGKVRDLRFSGGCHGNTQGLAALIEGMEVGEAVRRLKGIDCHGKGTSCPDQLSRALEQAMVEEGLTTGL